MQRAFYFLNKFSFLVSTKSHYNVNSKLTLSDHMTRFLRGYHGQRNCLHPAFVVRHYDRVSVCYHWTSDDCIY